MQPEDVPEHQHPTPEAWDVAVRWAAAVFAGTFGAMWPMMDANLRLCEAQQWVWANREHPTLEGRTFEELAQELGRLSSTHPFRLDFEQGRLSVHRERLPDDFAQYGYASRRREVGPNLEVLIALDPDSLTSPVLEHTTLLDPETSFMFLMRRTSEGWLLAGHDYQPPVPGWPPSSGAPPDVVTPTSS